MNERQGKQERARRRKVERDAPCVAWSYSHTGCAWAVSRSVKSGRTRAARGATERVLLRGFGGSPSRVAAFKARLRRRHHALASGPGAAILEAVEAQRTRGIVARTAWRNRVCELETL